MSTLYIRLPSITPSDSKSSWLSQTCQFALVSHNSAIERLGTAPLSELSGAMVNAQRVILLIAASDVTLLRVKMLPLSPVKMRAALPNLVEEHLISDLSECAVVAGGTAHGLQMVAVIKREWLVDLAKAMIAMGASHLVALPAQLCLPYQGELASQSNHPGTVVAAISENNDSAELTMRLSEHEGFGMSINQQSDGPAPHTVISTLGTLTHGTAIKLYVPKSSLTAYQEALEDSTVLNKSIEISEDSWPRWITGANAATLDLMAGLGVSPKMNWRPWRWPLALAASVFLINAAALNIDWWRMKNEASSLRTAMNQIYKSTYPKETVIIDPIAQMQQKIAIAKRASGLASPEDFTSLASYFGEAWTEVMSKGNAATFIISSLEYRERSLFVRLKSVDETATQKIRDALAKRELKLDLAPEQSGAVVWQIRRAS